VKDPRAGVKGAAHIKSKKCAPAHSSSHNKEEKQKGVPGEGGKGKKERIQFTEVAKGKTLAQGRRRTWRGGKPKMS